MNHLQFLRTIADDPESDAPRLVYADFLEESGHCDHAEHIRLSIELANHVEELPVVAVTKVGFDRHGPVFTGRFRDPVAFDFSPLTETVAVHVLNGSQLLAGFVLLKSTIFGSLKREADKTFTFQRGPKHYVYDVGLSFDEVSPTLIGEMTEVTLPTMPRDLWRAKTERVAKLQPHIVTRLLRDASWDNDRIERGGMVLDQIQRGFPTRLTMTSYELGNNSGDDVLARLPIETVEVPGLRFSIERGINSWRVITALYETIATRRDKIGAAIRGLMSHTVHTPQYPRPTSHEIIDSIPAGTNS